MHVGDSSGVVVPAMAFRTQLSMGRFGWRVEVRDYLSGFKGLNGELTERESRNDFMITSGLSVRF